MVVNLRPFSSAQARPVWRAAASRCRRCLEGILWVLRGGARWKDLPNRSLRMSLVGDASSSGLWLVFGTGLGAGWSVNLIDGEIEWPAGASQTVRLPQQERVSVEPNRAKAPNSWCSSMGEVCL